MEMKVNYFTPEPMDSCGLLVQLLGPRHINLPTCGETSVSSWRWWSCVEGSSVKESGGMIRLSALKAPG